MSDLTNNEPNEWNRGDEKRRCVAHTPKSRCRNWAIRGGVVCRYHGGSAPQVLAKARENLALAADHNRSNVQRLADQAESEQVRLQASNSLIDRVLGRPTTTVELGPQTLQPWETLMEGVASTGLVRGGVAPITRAESLARRGLAGPTDPDAPIDAEVVDDPAPDMRAPHPGNAPAGRTPADASDGPPSRPAFATGDVGPRRPGTGLMSMEDAVAGQRQYIVSRTPKKRR